MAKSELKELLGRMTLREKLGQLDQYVSPGHIKLSRELHGDKIADGDDTFEVYPGLTEKGLEELVIKGEIGSFLHVKDAKESNYLQSLAMKSRLKIPLLIAVDAIHGHGLYRGGATIFPTQWSLSMSWEPDLARETARITAREMRATGFQWTFSPNVEVARDPRWGRYGETFGEDPLLISLFGAAMVRGYKGDGPDSRVLSCIKHFAAGGYSEGGINAAPADVSERTLRSVILPPFKAGVDAGAETLMAAHNDLNGTPCHGNAYLCRRILRDEWGFKGFTVSDWMDMERLHTLFDLTETMDDAYQLSLEAGVDVHMHGPGFLDALSRKVEEGRLDEAIIDRAVMPILELKWELGLFQDCMAKEDQAETVVLKKEHRESALNMARRSLVLLSNDGILPLSPKKGEKIFLTGPRADDQSLLGDWSYPLKRSLVSTVRDGLEEQAPGRLVPDTAAADILIAAVGDNSLRTDPDKTCGENVDRADLDLPGDQSALVESLLATGKPVILVVVGGRPLDLSRYKDRAAAILFAGEPGMEGGRAVGEVLFGKVNPSGRLTGTFPGSVAAIPQYQARQKSHFFHKYCDRDSLPCFPFAHGLSYTDFTYGAANHPDRVKGGEAFCVKVEVSNTGDRPGEHIVPLFLGVKTAPFARPERVLAGFGKISLKPGESGTVEITVEPEQSAVYDGRGQPVWYPGEIRLKVDLEGPESALELE